MPGGNLACLGPVWHAWASPICLNWRARRQCGMHWASLVCLGQPDVLELRCQESIWHALGPVWHVWANLMCLNWCVRRQSGMPWAVWRAWTSLMCLNWHLRKKSGVPESIQCAGTDMVGESLACRSCLDCLCVSLGCYTKGATNVLVQLDMLCVCCWKQQVCTSIYIYIYIYQPNR